MSCEKIKITLYNLYILTYLLVFFGVDRMMVGCVGVVCTAGGAKVWTGECPGARVTIPDKVPGTTVLSSELTLLLPAITTRIRWCDLEQFCETKVHLKTVTRYRRPVLHGHNMEHCRPEHQNSNFTISVFLAPQSAPFFTALFHTRYHQVEVKKASATYEYRYSSRT